MDIVGYIDRKVAKLWEWFKARADSAQAQFWLFFAGFLDSFVIFFPPEALLAAMVTATPKYVVRYTVISMLATFIGALVAYAIGMFFFETIGASIIQFVESGVSIADIEQQFVQNAFLIIFLAMWTPAPSVPVVIAAGFFGVPLIAYVPAIILGRAVRFVPISLLAYYFGDDALRLFARYARLATSGVAILILLYIAYKLFL